MEGWKAALAHWHVVMKAYLYDLDGRRTTLQVLPSLPIVYMLSAL